MPRRYDPAPQTLLIYSRIGKRRQAPRIPGVSHSWEASQYWMTAATTHGESWRSDPLSCGTGMAFSQMGKPLSPRGCHWTELCSQQGWKPGCLLQATPFSHCREGTELRLKHCSSLQSSLAEEQGCHDRGPTKCWPQFPCLSGSGNPARVLHGEPDLHSDLQRHAPSSISVMEGETKAQSAQWTLVKPHFIPV